MPVIFREHGLRFMIFVNDHAPAHVHVRGRGEARIAIEGDCPLLSVKGMRRPDIMKSRDAVRQRQEELLSAWNEIHG